jgi:ribose 5-phosphate isomerase A
LKIRAVPTSEETGKLTESLNIPLIDINFLDSIDVTIDGADEFNSDLVLIKGGGGALLREKIVASMTKEEIIITDSTKRVPVPGKFKLPVEVIPFASNYVLRQIEIAGGCGKIRMNNSRPFITDEGNYIIDADFGEITNPINL